MGLGTLLARGAGLMIALRRLRRWWARHTGARAFAYAALYLTFLVPAYLLPALLVIELHGVEPGAAIAAWDPMFLLLPVCLLAPYALTRVYAQGKRWLAGLSAMATVLGLIVVLYLVLLEVSCPGAGGDSAWLDLFCRTQWQGWGMLALTAALHLAVAIWCVRVVSASASAAEQETLGAERKEAEREVSATSVGTRPDDGGGDGNGAKADSTPFWRKSAEWAQRTARQGAAKAGSGADALWRKTGRARAAAATAAHTGKRRLASAWRGLRDGLSGVAEKRGGGPDGGGAGA